MKVTPQNIRRFSDILQELLGHTFFQKEIYSLSKNISSSSLRNLYIKEQNAHPLARYWQIFQKDIKICEQLNTLKLNTQSILCLFLTKNLLNLTNLRNFERLVNDLKNKEKFFSTVFESRIAAEYYAKGYDVTIQDESGKENSNICDFIITASGENIYVECKSLNDIFQSEKRYWSEIYIRTFRLLEKSDLKWNIEIYVGKEVNGNDVAQICSVIKNDIDSKDTQTRSIDDDTIIIKKYPFTKDDLLQISKSIVTITDSTGNKGKMSVNGRMIASYFHNKTKSAGESHDLNENFVVTSTRMLKGGVPIIQNAFRISIYPHANYDLTKRLISNIKKASKQIPKNETGVVHIAIPNSIGNELVRIIDNSYDRIFSSLKRNHSRVNAVVIYGQFFERNPWGPLMMTHYIIPNVTPKKDLPSEFLLLGVEDLNVEIPSYSGKGTFVLDFTLSPEWRPGLTNRIFHQSTNDGRIQLKIVTTSENKLRLEVVTPKLGRLIVENQKDIDLRAGEEHTFVGRWKKDKIDMWINREKIGESYF